MLTVFVCVGSACHLKGSYNIINQFQRIIEERQLGEKVEIKAALCLGSCTKAISVRVGEKEEASLSCDDVERFFDEVVIKRLEE